MLRGRFGIALVAAAAAAAVMGVRARGGSNESPEALLAKAKGALDRKDYSEAESLARRLVARHGDSEAVVDARVLLIDALTGQRDLLRAAQECDKFLKAHPRSRRQSAVLKRLFELGKALTHARGSILVFTYSRLTDGVRALEKVVEHAPFGDLAADAIYAIGDAYLRRQRYEEARDQYQRLITHYPRSTLRQRAIIGRAACNYHLSGGAPYDPKPAREGLKDFDTLVLASGGSEVAVKHRAALRNEVARGDYEAGLFYFRRNKIEAGIRYLESILAQYADTPYAARARRILRSVIIARFPDTEYARLARRALDRHPRRAADDKEKP